jgi:hypothetical protein
MKFDPSSDVSQKTKKAILTYEDGDAEIWCKWQEWLDDLYWLIPWTTAKQQAKAALSLLHGKTLTLYLTLRSRSNQT